MRRAGCAGGAVGGDDCGRDASEYGDLEYRDPGARYLRYGGRVVVVLSVVTTAYTLLTTPEADLERVLHEEAGGLVGGLAVDWAVTKVLMSRSARRLMEGWVRVPQA